MEGFILAGGQSRRMGTPKQSLLLGGKTLIERAAEALATVADDGVSIVGSHHKTPCHLHVLSDLELMVRDEKAAGAIVGLYTALSAARSEWIAVLACDLPFVSGELFRELLEYRREDVDAIVPIQNDGRPQPLAALYRTATCAPAALSAIESGNRSMRELLQMVRTQFVPFSAFSEIKNAECQFVNINTPEDHEFAVEQWEAFAARAPVPDPFPSH